MNTGATLFQRIEDTLGLAHLTSDMDLFHQVETRLPVQVLEGLISYGLTLEEVSRLVIPRRTLAQRSCRSGSSWRIACIGRWHRQGRRILYCAANPATALLETLVHQEIDQTEILTFQYLAVDIPDEIPLETVRPSRLPPHWDQQLPIT